MGLGWPAVVPEGAELRIDADQVILGGAPE
jgi:hypothetical protein